MKNLFAVAAILFLMSATTISSLRSRSTDQLVSKFEGFYSLDEAKSFVSKKYAEGYRVVSICSISGETTSSSEVLVVLER